MKHYPKGQLFIWVCIAQTLLFLFISGCKKRDDLIELNTGAITNEELVYTDTISILTSTVKEDSFPTMMSSKQQLAGKMNDPLLGISEASIYTQVRLAALNNPITLSSGVDSAFLFIPFTSEIASYGNTNSTVSFELYELDESIESTRKNYSSDSISHKPEVIGSFTGNINFRDSIYFSDTVLRSNPPGIKFSITKEFAEKLLNASPTDLNTHTNFLEYMKGVCIKPVGNPASGEGAILGFNFGSDFSKIHVFYDNGEYLNFRINEDALKFSQYKIISQPANVKHQIQNSNNNYDTAFVQALSGAKAYFRFPNLFNLANEGRIFIHKAEMIIPVYKDAITDKYPAPTQLLLSQPDEKTNLNLPLIDLITDGIAYGGTYDKDKGEYRFVITRHIQNLFDSYGNDEDDFNFGLFLNTTIDLPITPARVLVDSRKNKPKDESLRLSIIYSKL